MEAKKTAQRGRPRSGAAKTSTQRGKAADDALVASGGRILSRVRLSAEAAGALAALSKRDGSDKAAIEQALTAAAKML